MHTQDGEAGGLWSRLGQPGETTLGVAYSADGFLTFAPYQVRNASHWLFADTGVRHGDLIGETGRNGAASAHETDKPSLQSPPNLVVLARGLNPGGLPGGRGRVHYPQPPLQWNGEGGAAMSYYDHPGGGGVFAAGSVAFTGSLVEDAVLSRVVANFIERFARSQQHGYQPPQNFQILPWPNPFTSAVAIEVDVPVTTEVSLEIFNVLGERIKVLARNEPWLRGRYCFWWRGDTDSGERCSSGSYFCRLSSPATRQIRKMTLVR